MIIISAETIIPWIIICPTCVGAVPLLLNQSSSDPISTLVPVCSGSEPYLSNCSFVEGRLLSMCVASVACPLNVSVPAFNLSQCNSPFQTLSPITDSLTTEPHSTNDTATSNSEDVLTTSSFTDETSQNPGKSISPQHACIASAMRFVVVCSLCLCVCVCVFSKT